MLLRPLCIITNISPFYVPNYAPTSKVYIHKIRIHLKSYLRIYKQSNPFASVHFNIKNFKNPSKLIREVAGKTQQTSAFHFTETPETSILNIQSFCIFIQLKSGI